MMGGPHPHIFRSTPTGLEKVIRHGRSFRYILARASLLDHGNGDTSSAEAIASYFLCKQQAAMDVRLDELQRLQRRIGLRKMMSLLKLSSRCTWEASLFCGSLYKSILNDKLSISRVQTLLEAPFPHSEVDDLLILLSGLQILFPEHTLEAIQDLKKGFSDTYCELTKHRQRVRVRALSQMSDFRQRTRIRVSHCRLAVSEFKESLTSRFSMCSSGMSGDSLTDQVMSRNGDDDSAAACSPGLHTESQLMPGFSSLRTAHVRLHMLERDMYAVNKTLDTLNLLVMGAHIDTLNPRLIESLRNEPLMYFDAVAEQITVCHARLRKHLDILEEQVLHCFFYINNSRDHVCFM